MSATNRGSTYIATFNGTSPLSGAIPSTTTEGQPLNGISSVSVIVQAPPGVQLGADGILQAYVYARILNPPDAGAIFKSLTSGSTEEPNQLRLIKVNSRSSNPIIETHFVTGDTSFATGSVAAITTGSNGSGSIFINHASGTFIGDEHLTFTTPCSWIRLPSADLTVTMSGSNAQMFAPFIVDVAKEQRIVWIPGGVQWAPSGSNTLTITQYGQAGTIGDAYSFLKD